MGNLKTFESDPFDGKALNFYERSGLFNYMDSFIRILKQKILDETVVVYSEIKLFDDATLNEDIVEALDEDRHERFIFNFVGEFDRHKFKKFMALQRDYVICLTPNFM